MSVGEIEIDLDALRSKRRGEARVAQRFLYHMGPRDAPRLPLSNLQYNELLWSTGGGIKHVTAWYARSLALFEYNVWDHPDLERFGRGVMASPFAPCYIRNDANLRMRFQPLVLRGLGPNLIWSPPVGPVNSSAQGEKISCWPSPNSRVARQRSAAMNARERLGSMALSASHPKR